MAKVRANGLLHHVQRLTHSPIPHTPAPHARVPLPHPPTIVLLHGAFIDSLASFYFTLGPHFADAGFDVLMYDLRGHGRSERPPTGYTLEDFTDDLAALLDALDIDGPVHLLGNSFGGTVALDFAVHHPERTACVTVVESGPATRGWAATMSGALHQATGSRTEEEALAWFVAEYGALASTRQGDDLHDAHIARLGRAAGRLIATTSIAQDIPGGRTLTDDQLRALDRPVLLINGQGGLVAEETARLATLLPHCEVSVVPGQKHSVLVEDAESVGAIALDWATRRLPFAGGVV
ncbi:alpha/beta fold hydrolase [Streptomyces sp. Je 1-369]|uniref:alpha/beta fold hydrolase n=1 Tax=Streptomyces sp. Je 1-369 TaxID=2966192 RepID=UPI00228636B5|nr:alpha/beta fold hydrolase [Streptomyces sp. Je 1-369]WAL99677.1 alpha/beta hydrolase [Streptomyces sp. Je 1-369]